MSEEKVVDEFRQELLDAKNTAESYVVLSLYKNTELYHDSSLSPDDFHDKTWKFYFTLLKKAVEDKIKVIDDIVIGLMIGESELLQKMYDERGGYQTISSGIGFVKEENFESYLIDVKKHNALIRLYDLGFPIKDNFEAYKAMPVDDIQNALNAALDTVFADVIIEEPKEDLRDGLWQVVMDAHEGLMRGFPYQSKLLTEWTNGQTVGNITMTSANSGVGKTAITLAQILPKMIEEEEKLLIMANEEDSVKWKREIITWVINNVIPDGDLVKNRFMQGSFSKDELAVLKKAVDWLEEKMTKGIISFINFSSFNMKKAIKAIKREDSLNGVKYFVLDTLKLDADAINENVQAWLQLQQGMVALYDVVKPSARNLHVWVTYQLGKSALLNRHLSQASLGMSKNVVDVVSVLILARKALDSEKEGGRSEVEVTTPTGKIKMNPDKEYFIVFLGKNRFGGTHRQLVFEVDMARNIMIDIGICNIPQDV